MYFLALGLIFAACKLLDVDPVAAWDWWMVLTPFGLAAGWWAWADSSGYTKAEEERKIERRRQARINRNKEALGIPKSKR
jgi:small Trp-rich protein